MVSFVSSRRTYAHEHIVGVFYHQEGDFNTKYTTKAKIRLTEFDAELPEKELSYG